MTKIEIDIAYDSNLQEFLLGLEGQGGRIVSFEAEGPGGGNPCFILEFSSDKNAQEYLVSVYGDDAENPDDLLDVHKIS